MQPQELLSLAMAKAGFIQVKISIDFWLANDVLSVIAFRIEKGEPLVFKGEFPDILNEGEGGDFREMTIQEKDLATRYLETLGYNIIKRYKDGVEFSL